MIDISHNTYVLTLFPLLIILTSSVLWITHHLRRVEYPVKVPSSTVFTIYLVVGILAWSSSLIQELGIIDNNANIGALFYLLTGILLFWVAHDHCKTQHLRNIILAIHALLIIAALTISNLYSIMEFISWYIFLLYPIAGYYFVSKAIYRKNSGYILAASGCFIVSLMAPFQLYELYNHGDAFLVYQLATIASVIGYSLVLISFVVSMLINEHQLLKGMAFKDPLTQALNRRGLNQALQPVLPMNKRKKTPFSLIIMDIDDYKTINDSFGHMVGDKALEEVAKIALLNCRESDLLCRIGGDEFVLVLPETTLEHAMMIAERIRNHISEHTIWAARHEINVTASFGLITKFGDIDLDSLIKRADVAQHQAKNQGKNCIQISEFSEQSN